MAYEIDYLVHNFGQYPQEMRAQVRDLIAGGWRVHTAVPSYGEVSILWVRDTPDEPEKPQAPAALHCPHCGATVEPSTSVKEEDSAMSETQQFPVEQVPVPAPGASEVADSATPPEGAGVTTEGEGTEVPAESGTADPEQPAEDPEGELSATQPEVPAAAAEQPQE